MRDRPSTPLLDRSTERRAERAISHFCAATGSTVWAPRDRCPFCSESDDDVDQDDDQDDEMGAADR